MPELFLGVTLLLLIVHCSLTAYNKIYIKTLLLQSSITSIATLLLLLVGGLIFQNSFFIIKKHFFSDLSFLNCFLSELTKIITILMSLLCLYLNQDFVALIKINNPEYVIIVLIIVTGLLLLITSHDLITIFVSYELQGLAVCVLAGMKTKSLYSVDSGLKYFLISSIGTAYFTVGWSFVFGLTGLFTLISINLLFFSNSSYYYDQEKTIESYFFFNIKTFFNTTHLEFYDKLKVTTKNNLKQFFVQVIFCTKNYYYSTKTAGLKKKFNSFKTYYFYLNENNIKQYNTVKKNFQLIFLLENIEIVKKKTSDEILLFNKKENYRNLSESLGLSSSIILLSFCFKVFSAPFHLWALDIYEGAPTSSTVFFAVVTKLSISVMIAKVYFVGFYNLLKNYLYQFMVVTSVSSILIGAASGIIERKLKSLLTYSSINNIGYVLITLTIGTLNSFKTMFFYLIIYLLSSLALWSSLASIQIKKNNKTKKKQNKDLTDISIIQKHNFLLSILILIALFSTAGLPPFIGFIIKINLFLVVVESFMYSIALLTILVSILSSFIYLRLVKIINFEKLPVGKLNKSIKNKNSIINNIFVFGLPYLFFKPSILSILSYKVSFC